MADLSRLRLVALAGAVVSVAAVTTYVEDVYRPPTGVNKRACA